MERSVSGITARKVLRDLTVNVDLSPAEAAKRVADPKIGWAYVDQRAFCPTLHDLTDLRSRFVKRPVLTTVEVLLKPVCGRSRTHFVTGYVHKPYPAKYAALARHAGQVLSREQLLEQVWGYDYHGDLRAVDAAIKRLRSRLRQAAPETDLIGTVRGVGYKLVG